MDDLHNDEWMMERIARTLDAVREGDKSGLEVELDLLAFAEDVMEHYNKEN